MVPAVYVRLESLPLTPNGKVDRKVLPARRGMHTRLGVMRRRRRDRNDRSGDLGRVVEVERVGRQDNFFALGGHSLLVVQTTARLRKSLGVEVRVDALFARPVLSDLHAEWKAPGTAAC